MTTLLPLISPILNSGEKSIEKTSISSAKSVREKESKNRDISRKIKIRLLGGIFKIPSTIAEAKIIKMTSAKNLALYSRSSIDF
jgi:hypothetical protein